MFSSYKLSGAQATIEYYSRRIVYIILLYIYEIYIANYYSEVAAAAMTFTRHHFSMIYYNIYTCIYTRTHARIYVYLSIIVFSGENISKGVFFCVHLHAELYKNKK